MGKIGAMAVMAAILAVWIKGIKPEYSLWVMAAAGVLMGGLALEKLEVLVAELTKLQTYASSYGTYFKLLLKVMGITYLAEFSSDLCKDLGAGMLASQVELIGKLSILVLCMPILSSLLETMGRFLGGA